MDGSELNMNGFLKCPRCTRATGLPMCVIGDCIRQNLLCQYPTWEVHCPNCGAKWLIGVIEMPPWKRA